MVQQFFVVFDDHITSVPVEPDLFEQCCQSLSDQFPPSKGCPPVEGDEGFAVQQKGVRTVLSQPVEVVRSGLIGDIAAIDSVESGDSLVSPCRGMPESISEGFL